MTDTFDIGPPVEGPPPGVPEFTIDELRFAAYTAPGGADAIYMKWQRGDATEQDWLDAVQLVKSTYPDPEEPEVVEEEETP